MRTRPEGRPVFPNSSQRQKSEKKEPTDGDPVVPRSHVCDPEGHHRAGERHRCGHRIARCTPARLQRQPHAGRAHRPPAQPEGAQQAGPGRPRAHRALARALQRAARHPRHRPRRQPDHARAAAGEGLPRTLAQPRRHGQADARADLRHSQRGQVDPDQHAHRRAQGQDRRRGRHHQARTAHHAGRRLLPVGHARHAVAAHHRAQERLQPGRQRRRGAQRLRRGRSGARAAQLPEGALRRGRGRALQAGGARRPHHGRDEGRGAARHHRPKARRAAGQGARQSAEGRGNRHARIPRRQSGAHHARDA